MRTHKPVDVDAAVIRLARQVDQLQHQVTDLATSNGELGADVATHGRGIRDLADLIRRTSSQPLASVPDLGDEEQVPPPEWLTVTDPVLAVEWLSALDQWARDVWRHFHPLVACWPWHPGVVAELLTCRLLWDEAIAPGAGPGGLGAWHDRWRPGAHRRIDRDLTACERDGAHIEGPQHQSWTADPSHLDELAVWWATTHGGGPVGSAPGLTLEARR